MWTLAEKGIPDISEKDGLTFVLDGVALLQLLPWQRRVTFASLLKMYKDYVQKTGQPVPHYLAKVEAVAKRPQATRRGSMFK